MGAEANENLVFKFDYAEPHPVLFKDSESRKQKNKLAWFLYRETLYLQMYWIQKDIVTKQ